MKKKDLVVTLGDPHMMLDLWDGSPVHVFGGPYTKVPTDRRRLKVVKMAEEIDLPCDISIPTVDFSVPQAHAMEAGVADAIRAILDGNDLFVFCMGGVGRTGLFMACLARALWDCQGVVYEEAYPITYVRDHYNPHAIETPKQYRYVLDFDTKAAWALVGKHPIFAMMEAPMVEGRPTTFFGYLRQKLWELRERLGL